MKTPLLILLLGTFCAQHLFSQCILNSDGSITTPNGEPCSSNIFTAVPFLNIEANPESLALGGSGVVAGTGNYSTALSQNTSLMARNKRLYDLHISYMPWLRPLGLDGAYFLNIGGMTTLGDRHAVGLNLKYFTFGEVDFSAIPGAQPIKARVYSYAFSGHYAFRLSDRFSLGIGLKYFVDDPATRAQPAFLALEPVKSIAGDIGMNYRLEKNRKSGGLFRWDIGLAINNIGPKVAFTNTIDKEFIPTILLIGNRVSWDFNLGATHQLEWGLVYQLDKLLVPSPCLFQGCDADNDGRPDFREQSMLGGMFSSFGDAPFGFKEEMREIRHRFGMEFRFKWAQGFQLGYLTGYAYEHRDKGNRQVWSNGISLRWSKLVADFAYLSDIRGQRSPLDGTLVFRVGVRDVI